MTCLCEHVHCDPAHEHGPDDYGIDGDEPNALADACRCRECGCPYLVTPDSDPDIVAFFKEPAP